MVEIKAQQPGASLELPEELQEQLSAINARRQELEADLELERSRLAEIEPELKRLQDKLKDAGIQEALKAVSEQMEKYKHEPPKKQLDRIFQVKIGDFKLSQLQANVTKLKATKMLLQERIPELKSSLTSLEKERKGLLAGVCILDIREKVKVWGDKWGEVRAAFEGIDKAIKRYSAIEVDLPGRLRSMKIQDPFLIEIHGMLNGSDMSDHMISVINRLASAWALPGNPFLICPSKPVTGQRERGKFGLERPFGGVK